MIGLLLGILLSAVPNPNPTLLDGQGRAFLYLGHGPYKLVLHKPGKSEQCLGQPVGEAVWTVDNLSDLPGARHTRQSTASQFFDKDGNVAAHYILCSYKAGTFVPKSTFKEPIQ